MHTNLAVIEKSLTEEISPVLDRDKKAEEAILNFVQDGLDKEGI